MKTFVLIFSLTALISAVSGGSILERLEETIAEVTQHFLPSGTNTKDQKSNVNIILVQYQIFPAAQKPTDPQSQQSQKPQQSQQSQKPQQSQQPQKPQQSQQSQISQPEHTFQKHPATTTDPSVVAPLGGTRSGPYVGSSTELRNIIKAAIRVCREGEEMDENNICRKIF